MNLSFPQYIPNVAIFFLSLYIIFRLKNYFKAVFLAFFLPGPAAFPVIGNAFLITDSKKLEFLGTHAYNLYGTIFRCWISVIPFFFVLDPNHLQTLMANGRLTKKNMFYTLLHNFIGEGLITNNGEKWRLHRKLIQPYFHLNILENFVPVFVETSNILLEKLENISEMNVTTLINDWVLETLHRAVLGVSFNEDEYKNSPFRKGQLTVPYRISRPWMLLSFIFNQTKSAENEKKQRTNLHKFTEQILVSKRNQELRSTLSNISILDTFMNISELDPSFTDQDIVNETCTFMLAGQDSVGAAVAFTLHFLAKHADCQEKVYNEQMKIFESSDSSDLNMNKLNEMKYLDQCIKETMRLYPSVPIICRELNEEITLGKQTFPAGTNIFISPFATHRLEYLYPNPLKFDPERFSENAKVHPFGYLPFSAGPRNCIGYKFAMLEMKTVISSVIRNFQLELVPGKSEINLAYRITLRAKGGVWIKFTKRKNRGNTQ